MKKQKEHCPVIAFFFCLCGVYACLWAATYALELEYPVVRIILYLAGLSAAAWLFHEKLRRRLFWLYIPFGLLAYGLREEIVRECLIVANTVLDDINDFYDFFMGSGYEEVRGQSDTGVLVFLGMSVITLLIFQILFGRKRIFVPLLLILPLMMGGILLNKPASPWMILLFMVFYVGICAVKTGGKKYAFTGAVCASVFLAAAFGIGSILATEEALDGVSNRSVTIREQFFTRFAPGLASNVSDGYVSRRDRADSDTERLLVTVDEEPTESLYIRSFTGGDYDGEKWEETDETDFFNGEGMEPEYGKAQIDTLPYLFVIDAVEEYYSNYFADGNAKITKPGTMTIQKLQSPDLHEYIPYISRELDDPQTMSGSGKQYRYYPQLVFDALWNTFSEDMPIKYAERLELLETDYREYVRERYLTVPEERLPRLSELVRENPMEDADEITDFIKNTLRDNISYTQTPERIPADAEIAEYVLFDGHEGYCVHFATAAVLMYRMYGIPARYAGGYLIKKQDFRAQDGTYTAAARDAGAHAWVEIYRDEMGWYPVEVTPGYGNGSVPAGNGETEQTEREETGVSAPEESVPEPDPPDDVRTDQQETGSPRTETGKIIAFICLWVLLAGEAVLIVLAGMRRRRSVMRRRFREMDGRQLFSRLLMLLHDNGILVGYDGLEDDFADRFEESFQHFDRKDICRMLDILSDAAWGENEISDEDRALIYRVYRNTARALYEKSGRWKRISMRYIRGTCPF